MSEGHLSTPLLVGADVMGSTVPDRRSDAHRLRLSPSLSRVIPSLASATEQAEVISASPNLRFARRQAALTDQRTSPYYFPDGALVDAIPTRRHDAHRPRPH